MHYNTSELSSRAAHVLLVFILSEGRPLPVSSLLSLTGITHNTLFKSLKELKKLGYIQRVSARPTLYALSLSPVKVEVPPEVTQQPEEAQRPKGPERSEESPVEHPMPTVSVYELADASGDRRQQIKVLQDFWDELFPIQDYPSQRLQPATAKEFLRLANNKTTTIYERLVDSVPRDKSIAYPRAYVIAILKKPDPHRPEGEGEITDAWRELARIANR